MPTRYLTAEDVLRFRDEAFLRYYTDPEYLDMVQQKFGGGMVERIRRMTAVSLERDLLSGKTQVLRPYCRRKKWRRRGERRITFV